MFSENTSVSYVYSREELEGRKYSYRESKKIGVLCLLFISALRGAPSLRWLGRRVLADTHHPGRLGDLRHRWPGVLTGKAYSSPEFKTRQLLCSTWNTGFSDWGYCHLLSPAKTVQKVRKAARESLGKHRLHPTADKTPVLFKNPHPLLYSQPPFPWRKKENGMSTY